MKNDSLLMNFITYFLDFKFTNRVNFCILKIFATYIQSSLFKIKFTDNFLQKKISSVNDSFSTILIKNNRSSFVHKTIKSKYIK